MSDAEVDSPKISVAAVLNTSVFILEPLEIESTLTAVSKDVDRISLQKCRKRIYVDDNWLYISNDRGFPTFLVIACNDIALMRKRLGSSRLFFRVQRVSIPMHLTSVLTSLCNIQLLAQMTSLRSLNFMLAVAVSFSFLSIVVADSDHQFYMKIELFRGATRLRDNSKANVGDRLSMQYTVQVVSRTTSATVCEEPLVPTELEVKPAANIFQDSSYTYDSGSLTEHNLEPANPLHFIPRSKGPLQISVKGNGCSAQQPLQWSIDKIIDVAGLTVGQVDTWITDGVQLEDGPASMRHGRPNPGAYYIGYHVTNEMSRLVNVGTINLVLREQFWLVGCKWPKASNT